MIGIVLLLINVSLIYGYELAALEIPKGFSHDVLMEPGDEVSIKICEPKKFTLKKIKLTPDIEKNLVYVSKNVRVNIPLNLLIRGNAFSFDTSMLRSCVIRMKYRDDIPLTATRRKVDFLFYYERENPDILNIYQKNIHVTLMIKDQYNYGCDFSFSGILEQSNIIDVSNFSDNSIAKTTNFGTNSNDTTVNKITKKKKWAILKVFNLFRMNTKEKNGQKQAIGSEITKIIENKNISKICCISLKKLPSRSFSFYCPGHLYPPNCFEQVYINNEGNTVGRKKIDGLRTIFGRFTRKVRIRRPIKNFVHGVCECLVGNVRYLMEVES